jgi:RNA polymerase sigma factor (sigma-70 family)
MAKQKGNQIMNRHERVYMSDISENVVSFSLYQKKGTNNRDRQQMMKILYRAMQLELTDRQRDCITMYFLNGMKMKDIAADLGLSRSTVTRHIQAATRKLRKVASYYDIDIERMRDDPDAV